MAHERHDNHVSHWDDVQDFEISYFFRIIIDVEYPQIFLFEIFETVMLDSITFKDFNFRKNINTFIQILIHFRPLNKTKWIFLINWKVNFVEKGALKKRFPVSWVLFWVGMLNV